MNAFNNHESIREINLSYLTLVQRLLREDRAEGMTKLGLSAPLADVLSGLSPEQTLKLASRDQLVCFFRLNGDAMLGVLGTPAQLQPVADTPALAQAA
jgi:flagellar transcriptional activator FlhD